MLFSLIILTFLNSPPRHFAFLKSDLCWFSTDLQEVNRKMNMTMIMSLRSCSPWGHFCSKRKFWKIETSPRSTRTKKEWGLAGTEGLEALLTSSLPALLLPRSPASCPSTNWPDNSRPGASALCLPLPKTGFLWTVLT